MMMMTMIVSVLSKTSCFNDGDKRSVTLRFHCCSPCVESTIGQSLNVILFRISY